MGLFVLLGFVGVCVGRECGRLPEAGGETWDCLCCWVCGSLWDRDVAGNCRGVVFQAFLQHPSNFPGEGKFDLRRLEKWWWHVLGCGSLLEGRGGGGLGCMGNMLLER